jgi:hypothetical protein
LAWAYLPLGLSILIAAGLAPALVSRIGVRLVAVAGAVLSLAGLVLFSRIPVDGQLLTDIVIPSVIVGLGGGLMLLSTTIAAMSGVSAERQGVASALLNVSRQMGGALGLAGIATVAAGVTARSGFAAGRAHRRVPRRVLHQRGAGRPGRRHGAGPAARRRARSAGQPGRAAGARVSSRCQ